MAGWGGGWRLLVDSLTQRKSLCILHVQLLHRFDAVSYFAPADLGTADLYFSPLFESYDQLCMGDLFLCSGDRAR